MVDLCIKAASCVRQCQAHFSLVSAVCIVVHMWSTVMSGALAPRAFWSTAKQCFTRSKERHYDVASKPQLLSSTHSGTSVMYIVFSWLLLLSSSRYGKSA